MLNIFGDRWTWLIIREAFYGATRFSEFERNTGIAKNLLSDRLSLLVQEGLLEKHDIGTNGTRHAYALTQKGRSLHVPMIAMLQWANEHLYAPGAAPVRVVEKQTEQDITPLTLSSEDGRPLALEQLAMVPGEAASRATRQRLAAIPDAADW